MKIKRDVKKSNNYLLFVVEFIVIGVVTVLLTSAAVSPNARLSEGEASASAQNATVINDASASGGAYIAFGQVPPPNPSPEPPTSSAAGVWITQEQIMQLPMSGTAWNNLVSVASGSLGTVDLSDNNSDHDTRLLALAYYAVRTSNVSLKNRVASEIDTVKNSPKARALEFCRNITSYIISADVVHLSEINPTVDSSFRTFVRQWVFEDTTLTGHSGDGIRGTAEKSPNNWGGMCRAAYAAAAVYLNDSAKLAEVTKWHKGFLGDRAVYSGFVYQDTDWHADQNAKRPINAKSTVIQGQNVDGVMPEDQRRTGEFAWPAPKGSYPWEALQGALVTDTILLRKSLVSANYQDNALVRAYTWLTVTNQNPAATDDEWQIWVVNKLHGTNFATRSGLPPGKNMAWTDWTHQ